MGNIWFDLSNKRTNVKLQIYLRHINYKSKKKKKKKTHTHTHTHAI